MDCVGFLGGGDDASCATVRGCSFSGLGLSQLVGASASFGQVGIRGLQDGTYRSVP